VAKSFDARRDERLAVTFADLMNRLAVGVIPCGRCPCFAQKTVLGVAR
jgi:hypothetical protein